MQNFNRKPALAFDCSTDLGSVALATEQGTQTIEIPRGRHAALLVPTIQTLLQNAGLGVPQLGAIITPLGPGSFTGLRIALATAHGLHAASGVPLYCPTTLQTLAFRFFSAQPDATHCTAVLNAGKGEAVWQRFKAAAPLPETAGDMQLHAITELPALLDGETCVGNVPLGGIYAVQGISAADLCAMAPFLSATPAEAALPLYVRPPDAKIPQAPAWLASSPVPE